MIESEIGHAYKSSLNLSCATHECQLYLQWQIQRFSKHKPIKKNVPTNLKRIEKSKKTTRATE